MIWLIRWRPSAIVEILESELIGLVPKCAFAGTTPKYLKLKDFDKPASAETHLKAFSI